MNMIRKNKGKFVYALSKEALSAGVSVYVNLINYPMFREQTSILDRADRIYVDSIFTVWFLKLFYGVKVSRLSPDNTSIVPYYFQELKGLGKTNICVIGGKPNENQVFTELLREEHPDYNIEGFDGYSDEYLHLDYNNYDVVIAGLGSPKQELFAIDLQEQYPHLNVITCGAYISQGSQGLEYFPPLADKLHLRMVYRLFKEGLYSRLPEYPKSLAKFIKDWYLDKSS